MNLGTMTLTIETRPNDKGEQRFVLDWRDQRGRPHVQDFLANVEKHAARLREHGWDVIVKEAIES